MPTRQKLNPKNESLNKLEWNASWIHNNVAGTGPRFVFFRKEINVLMEVAKAVLYITAAKMYKLYINGIFVGEGPVRSNTHYWSYDCYDISQYLERGVCVIGVIVTQWEPNLPKPLALLAQGEIHYIHGSSDKIMTDQSWKVYNATGWRADVPPICWNGPVNPYNALGTGYVEVRDLRVDPKDWYKIGFNDKPWSDASVFKYEFSNQTVNAIGHIWRHLVERDIPYLRSKIKEPKAISKVGEIKGSEIMMAKNRIGEHLWVGLEDIRPLDKAIVENAEGLIQNDAGIVMEMGCEGEWFGRIIWQPAIIFDIGELLNGYIQLDIEAGDGAVIDVSFSQTLQDGKVYPYVGGLHTVNRYILREGRQNIESVEYANCRYVQITLSDSEKPIKLHSLGMRAIEYPTDNKAEFSCSDTLLTKIWHATERTTALCTNDAFMDNPWREKNAWNGDILTIILSALTCYGNLDIIKRTFRMFSYDQLADGAFPDVVPGHLGWLFDLNMAYPIKLQQYYDFTGDIDLLSELYPNLKKYMEYLERYENGEGIIDKTPLPIWFDWTILDRRQPSTILNLFYYNVLCSMTKIAKSLNLSDDAFIYEAKSNVIRNCIEKFWDQRHGVFPDCVIKGEFSENISENTNGIALCNNLLAQDRIESIIKNVFSNGFDIHKMSKIRISSPQFAIYVLSGLCDAGYHRLALDYLKQRHGSAFQQGLDTMPESWFFSSRGETSAVQASLPASYILTTEILGIKPQEPGFKKTIIKPNPCDLSWARGSLITSRGVIKVEWRKINTCFTVSIEVPADMEAVVKMPYKGSAISVNDAIMPPCCHLEKNTNRYCVSLREGKHSLKLENPELCDS